MIRTLRNLGLIAAAGIGLAACTDGYGYSGVSVGYGSGGYYDDYWDGGYYGYGGSPYWGWYGDYYYPGTGYYVYDRYRRPHRWTDRQRYYWERRRNEWRGNRGDQPNWDRWDRGGRRWDGRRDGDNDGRWGGGRNITPEQRQQWQQRREQWRNATPEQRQQWQQGREQRWRDATPEQRQQWQQRREQWRGATPEQRQQWQQRREQWRGSQGQTQPRATMPNRPSPSIGGEGRRGGGWSGRGRDRR